jgi:carbon-monoxide dehydrogenase large subunit/6-hydroxypseudooxynicotine dehydrogenase subunit gamma
MGYVGSRMRRLEDPRLLAGVGHFADDEERPGQLWMRVVRSPVAHAVLGGPHRPCPPRGARRCGWWRRARR